MTGENDALFSKTAPVAMVVGASGGIGLAVVKSLLADKRWQVIHATYHSTSEGLTALAQSDDRVRLHQLNILDEDSLQNVFASVCSENVALGFLCCATGLLHEQGISPEKRLAQLEPDNLSRLMNINCVGPTLMLKHAGPLLLKRPAVIALLSAKVGSIDDNRLGGWHSYRASKAALNMMIRTISIEWGRRNKSLALIAFHPGTTDTGLSKPFQGNVPASKLFSVERCASQLLTVVAGLTASDNGEFFGWDGGCLAW